MSLIDSHCHLDRLDLEKYNGSLDKLLESAKDCGVSGFLSACVQIEEFNTILAITKKYENVVCSVGVHPSDRGCIEPTVEELAKLAQEKNVVAIGETGLDYYHNKGDLTWQQDRFRTHIRAAILAKKPIIVHSRDSSDDTISILKEERAREACGVLHCFTADWEMAKHALDLGFYISFSGIVTFKNADSVREVVRKMPMDRMLIETDSPYLAPAPFRGKSNEPAYLKHVAEFLANWLNIDIEKFAEITNNNFNNLFFVNFTEVLLKN